jgi:hypothetical protein
MPQSTRMHATGYISRIAGARSRWQYRHHGHTFHQWSIESIFRIKMYGVSSRSIALSAQMRPKSKTQSEATTPRRASEELTASNVDFLGTFNCSDSILYFKTYLLPKNGILPATWPVFRREQLAVGWWPRVPARECC